MPTTPNELFRFAIARPPSGIGADGTHWLPAPQNTSFETAALQAAATSPQPKLRDVATKFLTGTEFGIAPVSLMQAASETLRALERELLRAGSVSRSFVDDALQRSNFAAAVNVAGGDKLADRLWSRITALHCAPASDVGELIALSQCIRALQLQQVSSPTQMPRALRMPLALPLTRIRQAFATPPRAPAKGAIGGMLAESQKKSVQVLGVHESLARKLDAIATARSRLKKPAPADAPLSASEHKELSPAERNVLTQIDADDAPLLELLPRVRQALQTQVILASTAGRDSTAKQPQILESSEQKNQGALVSLAQLSSTAISAMLGDRLWNSGLALDLLGDIVELPPIEQITEGLVPRIRPLGVLDLKRVDMQLNHYQLGDVAHVENVLASEFRERVHKREDTVEEVLTTESQLNRETERNLESTERFEMQKESSRVLSEQMQVTAGVSASFYGPSFNVGVNAGFTYGRSEQDAQKASTKYAKEVVEKTREKVEERIREQRTTTRRVVVQESNTHRFDNSGSDSTHKVGVYRFVDKLYDARLLNYGRRMMFEFLVPEPAVVLRNTEQQTSAKPAALPALDIEAWQLNATNYQHYAGVFGAREVAPPPPQFMAVSAMLERSKSSPASDTTSAAPVLLSGEITVPSGYAPVSFRIAHGSSGDDAGALIQWAVGDTHSVSSGIRLMGISAASAHYFSSTRPVDKIPAWVLVGPTKQAAASVTVECVRLDAAMQAWRTDTYSKIREAFEIRLADTLEANRRLESQQRKGISAGNDATLRRRERDELTRGCITLINSLLLQGNYFDATNITADGVVMDVSDALREGHAVRFFQGAYEWDNMTYELFPYFWGKRERWAEMLLASHEEPKHQEFLRSGFARVTVPVKPGQEVNVLNFLSMGLNAVFDGAREAVIDDPEYLALLAEIDAPLDPPMQEGDPWQVVVPTTLVKLQLEGEEEALGLRGTQ
jgi:hypothetical protein